MKSIFPITFIFTFLLLFPNSVFSQQIDDYSTKIDNLIKTKNVRPFNGVIFISQNGNTKYSKAYGYANIPKKTPLKLSNQFEIMSNSKQITAVLLLKEVEKGKVDIQSPIKKYLPYIKQPWANTVKVYQLLNHTHGIVDINRPLSFKPGANFKYGNLSFNLIGKIIEFSAKKPYSEMANDLFKQLKMNNTSCYAKNKLQNLVSGHVNQNNAFTVVRGTMINRDNFPADGIITTANDLGIWNNNLHKGKILKPATYNLMTNYSVTAQHNAFGKDKVGYGYGIRISDKGAIKYIGHTGLGDGFSSVNIYFPKNDVSLIVLENQMTLDMNVGYYFGTEIKKILLNSNLVK